jgi:trimethylamine--corrinoid protein Co-methyltransferase
MSLFDRKLRNLWHFEVKQPLEMMMSDAPRRRSGGRAGNTRGNRGAIEQMPWRMVENTDRPIEPLTEDGIQAIHDGAMTILEDIGIEFLNTEALAIFKDAGCKVEGEKVFLDRHWVMEMIAKAPSEFTITPRNPAHEVTVGGNKLLFGNVSSPPNYWDMELGRKMSGTREKCQDFFKLSQYFNCIHFVGGYPVEPVDVHASIRHLEATYDKLTLTDKAAHTYCLGSERVEDTMEMVRIAGGLSHDEFESKPHMYTNINSTSPLKHDWPMIDGCLRLARRGQAIFVTPVHLGRCNGSGHHGRGRDAIHCRGALCHRLVSICAPGIPCVIGTFTSNVDMKTGAPAFGTAEYMRATQMTGQMGRFYKLPIRSSGVCAANVPDGQAMWETSNSLWAAVQSGSNVVYHAAGWLEGGLIASPEKFIMDCEVLQLIQRYFEPIITRTAPEDIAIEAIKEVGSSGHFFGVQHTQDRYETAFHQPFISDWRNYEGWELAGGIWTAERASAKYKEIMADYKKPPMDEAIHEELRAFVDRRVSEGGAPTDF